MHTTCVNMAKLDQHQADRFKKNEKWYTKQHESEMKSKTPKLLPKASV